MPLFFTTFHAIDKTDGSIKEFEGKYLSAPSWFEAERFCKHFAPYLTVKEQVHGAVAAEYNIEYFTTSLLLFEKHLN